MGKDFEVGPDYEFLKAYAEYRVTGVLKSPRSTGLLGRLRDKLVSPLLGRLWPPRIANTREKPSGDDGYEMVCPNCESRATVFMTEEEYLCMLDDGGYPCGISTSCNELMQPVEEKNDA